jgi:hypothetical protein
MLDMSSDEMLATRGSTAADHGLSMLMMFSDTPRPNN